LFKWLIISFLRIYFNESKFIDKWCFSRKSVLQNIGNQLITPPFIKEYLSKN